MPKYGSGYDHYSGEPHDDGSEAEEYRRWLEKNEEDLAIEWGDSRGLLSEFVEENKEAFLEWIYKDRDRLDEFESYLMDEYEKEGEESQW